MHRRKFIKLGLCSATTMIASGCSYIASGCSYDGTRVQATAVGQFIEKSKRPKPAIVLRAAAFGVVGDGTTDDGPAVLKLLEHASSAQAPTLIQFEHGKSYFLATARERYAFNISGAQDLTIDGGNSLFLIDSRIRFMSLTNSRRTAIRNMRVDYSPLPFADGLIIAKDIAGSYVDVRINDDTPIPPLGGPTHQDGEQEYFGLLWHEGPYSTPEEPYYTRDNFAVVDVREAYPNSLRDRVVRVATTPQSALLDSIVVNSWRLSVPVRGVAHRAGPGETCIVGNNDDATFTDVEIWSAPWFAFGVHNNTGHIGFSGTSVRPRLGTKRLFSAARDSFHVKNNRSSLLWDGCTVQGSGDDAFNISTHASTVHSVASPTEFTIQQNFPLGIADMLIGDTLVAYDEVGGKILGRGQITAATIISPASAAPGAYPQAPVFSIKLDRAINGVAAAKTLIWNATCANPKTTLKNCRIDVSCRFRSPISIDACHIYALSWFTGDELEAPIPSSLAVTNSTLKVGDGNPTLAVVVEGPRAIGHGPTQPVIFDVLFQNNRIYGDVTIRDAANAHLSNNQFEEKQRQIMVADVHSVRLSDNTVGGTALNNLNQIKTGSPQDAAAITFSAERKVVSPYK